MKDQTLYRKLAILGDGMQQNSFNLLRVYREYFFLVILTSLNDRKIKLNFLLLFYIPCTNKILLMSQALAVFSSQSSNCIFYIYFCYLLASQYQKVVIVTISASWIIQLDLKLLNSEKEKNTPNWEKFRRTKQRNIDIESQMN